MTATRIASKRVASAHSCRGRRSPASRRLTPPGRPDRFVPDRFVEVRRVDNRPRSTSAATYRRRRAVAGAVLAAIVALTIVAGLDVLAGSGGVPASAAASQPAHAPVTVVVQPGESLWSIAAAHHGEGSITRYLDTLVDLNGGPTIHVGQTVLLP